MIEGFTSKGFKHFTVANFFDALTTFVLVIQMGAVEVNPVVRNLVLPHGFTGLMVFKAVMSLFTLLTVYLAFNSRFSSLESRVHKFFNKKFDVDVNYGNALIPFSLLVYFVVVGNSIQLIVLNFL